MHGDLAVDHDPNVYYYERVRTEIMRTFGYFQTESSHHAGEYTPWFRKDDATIKSYIKDRWDYYDCGVNFDLKGQIEWVKKKCREELHCSLEYGAAHHPRHGNERAHRHLRQRAQQWRARLADLRPDAPDSQPPAERLRRGRVPRRSQRHPATAPGPLPPQLAAINRTNINVQELTVLAHQTGDPQIVEQAVAMDRLTSALLTLPQIRSLTQRC